MRDKKVYFNIKSQYGVETVDELSKKDFIDFAAFNTEVKRLSKEYALAGMSVYVSQRSCKEWDQQ